MLAKRSLRKSSSGFTLIELLIVVAIIAILLSLGAASYTTAQRKGRDTQRKSDLKKIQSALESYYSDGNKYPANGGGGSQFTCAGGTPTLVNWGAAGVQNFYCNAITGVAANNTYLKGIPEDPQGVQYCYISSNSEQNYTLYAKLENAPPSTDPNYHDGSADGNCNSSFNYKVSAND